MIRVTTLVATLLLAGAVVAHAQLPFEISVAAGPVFAQGLSYQEEPAGVELSAGIMFPSLDHMWSIEVRLHHTTGLESATWFPATLGLQF